MDQPENSDEDYRELTKDIKFLKTDALKMMSEMAKDGNPEWVCTIRTTQRMTEIAQKYLGKWREELNQEYDQKYEEACKKNDQDYQDKIKELDQKWNDAFVIIGRVQDDGLEEADKLTGNASVERFTKAHKVFYDSLGILENAHDAGLREAHREHEDNRKKIDEKRDKRFQQMEQAHNDMANAGYEQDEKHEEVDQKDYVDLAGLSLEDTED